MAAILNNPVVAQVGFGGNFVMDFLRTGKGGFTVLQLSVISRQKLTPLSDYSQGYFIPQSARNASITEQSSSDFLKQCTSDSVLPERMQSVAWTSSYS